MKTSNKTGPVTRLLAALAAALATLCGPAAATDAPPGAVTATKLDAVTLRLDWLINATHAPFFLGLAKDWYRQAGIDLTIREGRGSGTVVQLVGNNSDTFGFAGADAVVRAVNNRIPVIAVASIMPKNSDTMFVLRSSGIARPQDLKGRTIATSPGGTSDALLPAFLAAAGLAKGDVTIVPVDAAMKAQLIAQGRLDASALPSWVGGQFAMVGGATGFPFADYGVQVVGYGVVTNTETAKGNPDLVTRFVAVTTRAWDYAVRNPEEALAALEKGSAEQVRPNMAARNRAELPELLKWVRPAVPGKPYGTQSVADWEAMLKQLIQYGVIRESHPIGQYLTNDFVR